MKKTNLAALLALALGSTPVFAYDYSYTQEQRSTNGFESLYAGAGMGIAGGDAGEKCGDLVDCLTWKSFVGYRTGKHMALEAGFHSLLDARDDSGVNDDLSLTGLSMSVLGITPAQELQFLDPVMQYLDFIPNAQNMELFGKLGMSAWKSKVNGDVAVSGTDFILGAGAQVKLGENLGARSEVEYLGGDADSLNYGASLTYSTF